MLGIDSVERMIRKRRLQWVAHSARRGQGDFTWKGMMREVEDEESAWGQQIRNDWNELEVEGIDQWTTGGEQGMAETYVAEQWWRGLRRRRHS